MVDREERNALNYFLELEVQRVVLNIQKKMGENSNNNITIDIVEEEIWFVGTHIVSYESTDVIIIM